MANLQLSFEGQTTQWLKEKRQIYKTLQGYNNKA